MAALPPGEALLRTKQITDQISVRESEFRSAAARELLSLYNGLPSGKSVEADEIKINLANAGSAGCATLYYADGDLFAGSAIEVLLDAGLHHVKSQLIGKQMSPEDYGYLTRKPDAAEALAWLREAKAPGDRTITGGDGKGWRGAKAIAVVR